MDPAYARMLSLIDHAEASFHAVVNLKSGAQDPALTAEARGRQEGFYQGWQAALHHLRHEVRRLAEREQQTTNGA
jgi:hypothetical protein